MKKKTRKYTKRSNFWNELHEGVKTKKKPQIAPMAVLKQNPLPLPVKDIAKSFEDLKEKMRVPSSFPENPLELSIIQEHLLDIKGTDVLSLAIRLGAKTDIRAIIAELQTMHEMNATLIATLIDEYPLELILAY